MAALRSLSFCLLAVGLLLPAAASIGQTINKTAEPGENVTLPCEHGKEKIHIIVLEWTKHGLEKKERIDVFIFRDGHFASEGQHESFKNRVHLQDGEMKDGNASLILKNVKINDTGTYLCRVYPRRRYLELISIIHLVVSLPPPAPPPDSSPPHLGLMLLLRLLVFCPYFISTLLLVSVYRLRAKGSKQPVSVATAPPPQAEPGLDDDYDDITTEHQF